MNYSFVEFPQTIPMVSVGTLYLEPGTPAVLLFDSFYQPASAGMRSGAPGRAMNRRQMLYRADPYQIDLQLEADGLRNRLIVTGQLLDASRPEITCLNVQVTLSNLHGNVVQAATNQFGEFRGEVEYSGDLELSFLGPSGTRIVILLRGVLESSSSA